jgi:hypothetical protein
VNNSTLKLAEVAKAIRSKNAKSFHLTLDVFFKDADTYSRVRDRRAITKEQIQTLYPGLEMTDFIWFDPGAALKVTFRRPQSVGSPGDTDVFGCQQHAPLYDIELPVDILQPKES